MLRRLAQITASTTLRPASQPCAVSRFSSNTAETASKTNTEKWDLYAGVLVERLPVISQTLNPLERQFQELLWRTEFENSLKSNNELQHERELIQAELVKKGAAEVDLEETSSKLTVQDARDAHTEELKKFALAPRITPHEANTASTNRCLEQTLYLLIEQRLGAQAHFLLPQGVRLDGETMRQTADRVLREKCGDQLQVLFNGHAPCGFYKYKYPTAMRSDARQSVGAKVFFYRATLRQGNVLATGEKGAAAGGKFEWLERAALDAKLKNAAYAESVRKFLI